MKKPRSSTQATHVSFELHTLGWKAFQDLCVSITTEILGQTVQNFLPVNDGGRDGAFFGTWNPEKGVETKGSFVIQCKFTADSQNNLVLSMVSDELKKAKRLASKGLCDNYILMTNHPISGNSEETIKEAFQNAGIMNVLFFGADWITQKIRESPRLRRLVPRVYGLGDLSQILDERAYSQAQEILSSMRDDLGKFVLTDAYRKSSRALFEHGFVLLLGEPASGKSLIAASLALGACDYWGCSTLKIKDAEDFQQHWNSDDSRQFFWVDDVFGATQYQNGMADSWNRIFRGLEAAIKKGAKVIFTSRDYIFRRASEDLKVDAFPLIGNSQVIIEVQKMSLKEKQQILYNHIKLGDQESSFKRRIKPHLEKVASNTHFLPEIARRLGSRFFTENLTLTEEKIVDFVEKPILFLGDVIKTLSRDYHSALALIFMRGGILESPVTFSPEELNAIELIGGTPHSVRGSLNEMRDSLTKLEYTHGTPYWKFKHPTIIDAFGEFISTNPEFLDIYLAGTPTKQLIQEVTCGDVALEGVKIIIPPSRYEEIIDRLLIKPENFNEYFNHLRFLAHRCSKEFLTQYLIKDNSLLNRISEPSPWLEGDTQVHLLAKLHSFGLLPDEIREDFVEIVERYAIDEADPSFLSDDDVRKLLTDEEIENILIAVREDLISNLNYIIELWQDRHSPDEDPEEHFAPLAESLERFNNAYSNDLEAKRLIKEGLSYIESCIEDLNIQREENIYDDYDEDTYRSRGVENFLGDRSVFDDVDS